jgi:hypothetical protein
VWNELMAGEADLFKRRLADRAVDEFLPADQHEAKAKLMGIVAAATDRLKSLARSHTERADADKAREAARLSFDDSKEGERLRRCQFSCGRALHKTLDTLLKIRRAEEKQTVGLLAVVPTVPDESQPVEETYSRILVGEDNDPAPADLVADTRSEPLDGSAGRNLENEPTTAVAEYRKIESEPTTMASECRKIENEPTTMAPEHRASRNESTGAPAAQMRLSQPPSCGRRPARLATKKHTDVESLLNKKQCCDRT